MKKSHLLLQAFAAAVVVCLALPCTAQPRIVAVGDIHGACTGFVAFLQQIKIIDDYQQWIGEHPLGFFERRDAFGPLGIYVRWLRAHEAMAKTGDGLFMHGGLNPDLPSLDIAELNHRIHHEIASFDLLWKSLSEKVIIWKYMTMSEATGYAERSLLGMGMGTRDPGREV